MPEDHTFSDGRPMDAITNAAIAEAIAKERERCAKIMENFGHQKYWGENEHKIMVANAVEEIRSPETDPPAAWQKDH